MLEFIARLLEDTLNQLGITAGMVCWSIQHCTCLGKPTRGIQSYFDVLQAIIGEKGTLVVPTFTLDFPRTQIFDRQKTPSKGMGSFSEYVRQLPGSLRSSHPMQSVAAHGFYARDLADRDTHLLLRKARSLPECWNWTLNCCVGADIQAVSMVHYCEAKVGVPYRIWKDFSGRIFQDGSWVNITYRMYARRMELDPRLILQPIRAELESMHAWHELPVNYGKVSSCSLQDFVAATDRLIREIPGC